MNKNLGFALAGNNYLENINPGWNRTNEGNAKTPLESFRDKNRNNILN